MTGRKIKLFKNKIWEFYKKNKREFPWRETSDSYEILVSEFMLQQTQTNRVLPKYLNFLKQFPQVEDLAKAPLEDVLREWSGLGYNRRAVYLKKAAEALVSDYKGIVPDSVEALKSLPGIGGNTAGAIIAFSYDEKVVFIETNIRRVFIHEFFQDRDTVDDREIKKLIEQSLPERDFRNWYYALMDYGVMLAKTTDNPNKKSRHYSKQPAFQGSRRQLRGHILRVLLKRGSAAASDLKLDNYGNDYLEDTLQMMVKEGIIKEEDKTFTIA